MSSAAAVLTGEPEVRLLDARRLGLDAAQLRDHARELGAGSDREIASAWSGKEALAKALGDPVAYDPRRLQAPGGWPGGRSGPWRCRRLTAPDGHVAWVCWRSR